MSFRPAFEPEFVMVCDRPLVKQVLAAPPDQLLSGDHRVRRLLGDRSIVALEPGERLDRRKLVAPYIHGKHMRAQAGVIRAATDRAIDGWPVGRRFALLPSLRVAAAEVMAEVALGFTHGPHTDDLRRRVFDLLMPVHLGPFRRRRMNPQRGDRQPVDELLHKEIQRRRQDLNGQDDVLSALLRARDADGRPLADGEISDHLVLLMVAGSQTTANGAAWALELLLRHPSVLARLRAGGDRSYLQAVVLETLRLRPPVRWVPRIVNGDPYEVGDYVIPPGTMIRAWLPGDNGKGVFTEPRLFRPERFLEPTRTREGEPGLPFGAGPNRCLGASFASFEIGVIIERIVERTRLRPVGRPERSATGAITQVPARGVRVIRES